MPGQLVGVSPNQIGRVYWLDTLRPVTIGRLGGNDIILEKEPSVSARHALVYWASPHFCVEDLGSANGTFVNGERVQGHMALHHEDLLQLGEAQFRFLVEVQPHPLDAAGPAAGTGPVPAPARSLAPEAYRPRKDRVTAGVLGILLGALGVHLFYLNRTGWGLAFLLFTLFTCGYGAIIPGAIGLVQGILYLVATDAEFQQKYVVEDRLF